MKRVIAVLVWGAVCGCSSNSSGVDGSSGGSCTVTLTGSESATAKCVAAFAKKDTDTTSEFGATVSMEPAGFTSIVASFGISGVPMVKTYTAADFPFGGASVVTTAPKTYVAAVNPVAGTVGSLVITTATAGPDSGSAVDYTVHGSFNATLAQSGGGSGTVMMAVSF
jgi:hypothetical protein